MFVAWLHGVITEMKRKRKGEILKLVAIRIPLNLIRDIDRMAESNRRSINCQYITLLEEALGKRKKMLTRSTKRKKLSFWPVEMRPAGVGIPTGA